MCCTKRAWRFPGTRQRFGPVAEARPEFGCCYSVRAAKVRVSLAALEYARCVCTANFET